MDKLFSIRQPITEELALLNKTLTESLHTTSPLMNEVIQAYLESKGKQIRPILVLLCAKLFGEVPREAIDAAASLEMLHNASLIHDDVVDESQKRRGLPTINHLYDNRIAGFGWRLFRVVCFGLFDKNEQGCRLFLVWVSWDGIWLGER